MNKSNKNNGDNEIKYKCNKEEMRVMVREKEKMWVMVRKKD